MISFKGQRILIIAPHPDDEVFGCGGLIHKCKQEGGKVYVLFLTVGTTMDFSKKGISTLEERIQEIEKVSKFLGFDGWRIAFPGNNYHLKLDAIPQKDIIDEIERGEKISLEALDPTMVITTSVIDYNQDHRAAGQATITATRPVEPVYKKFQPFVLTYELPSGGWTTENAHVSRNFYIHLSKANLQAKVKALRLYKSQMKTNNGGNSIYGSEAMARIRGIESGSEYAEAFVIKRVVIM